MNVTKTQLRDFVDNKIATRKRELRDEIKQVVQVHFSKAIDSLLGDLSELSRLADRFGDLLSEKIDIVGKDVVSFNAITAIQQANKLANARQYFLDALVVEAVDRLISRHNTSFKSEAFTPTFNEINAVLQPKINLYREGLDTLKNELHAAISNESSGKRAYNALVALGVDMTDLPEVSPNLPAVTKLSVDVCVINNTCGDNV